MNKRYREIVGYLLMIVGMSLIIFAGYAGSEEGLSASTRGVTATVAGLGGGVLTFVVSRRMLAAQGQEEEA